MRYNEFVICFWYEVKNTALAQYKENINFKTTI